MTDENIEELYTQASNELERIEGAITKARMLYNKNLSRANRFGTYVLTINILLFTSNIASIAYNIMEDKELTDSLLPLSVVIFSAVSTYYSQRKLGERVFDVNTKLHEIIQNTTAKYRSLSIDLENYKHMQKTEDRCKKYTELAKTCIDEVKQFNLQKQNIQSQTISTNN